MADAYFENQRLADLYDEMNLPERPDLDLYLQMAEKFETDTVIDLGCGTGALACKLAAQEVDVIGVDPAAASLAVAKRKTYADKVNWFHGTIDTLPDAQADLVTMTGNVAQVFVTDEEWMATLIACKKQLRPGGRLMFEVRNPAKEAWKNWTQEETFEELDIPSIGKVETWTDLLSIQLPLVTFRHTFRFHQDDKILTSESTLRFRSKHEVLRSLEKSGLDVEDILDAPDRRGLEYIFIARKPSLND
ncbi:class I SAM-dependent methyltransferase [Aureibacillus halotolerans]|uniref:Ubiquinone/menaquinone biosynthesis C-methylase UbiE n=1 Tax=Aureibacillus halotolerans TaxID=1508390 RepID=A0A4R6UCY0_9BACI|nr:class I SAM-dependent methyltransferase [Aureibacillus halotolerans]TDQ42909.1 ubiquinone/menaquinone biosynthesis C-methylase UbiE [Aureibacillus halotolerans]